MAGEMIQVPVNGRSCAGYLATPESGTGPGLILLQEWWGLVDHIKEVADRFAVEGFVTLAPDLYGGESTTSPDEAGRMMMALDIDGAGKDLESAASFLRGHAAVAPKKIAALGFCMGGQLALYAGQVAGLDAVVDFYGIHPKVEVDFGAMEASVQCHFAKHDEFVKLPDAEALVAEMKGAGVSVDAHYYDTGHAFFNDSRPEAHDKDAAAAAWKRSIGFLREHLA